MARTAKPTARDPRRLAYGDKFISVDPMVAQAVGLREAIVLSVLHYLLVSSQGKRGHDHDGRTWVYNSYQDWAHDYLPFYSAGQVETTFRRLEKRGLVITAQRRGYDRRKDYSIDYDALDRAVSAVVGGHAPDALAAPEFHAPRRKDVDSGAAGAPGRRRTAPHSTTEPETKSAMLWNDIRMEV